MQLVLDPAFCSLNIVSIVVAFKFNHFDIKDPKR